MKKCAYVRSIRMPKYDPLVRLGTNCSYLSVRAGSKGAVNKLNVLNAKIK